MDAKERDQEFVEYVVKSIVSQPDTVQVSRNIDEKGVLLELTVDPTDMGVIIGKEGKTVNSIRTLLRVLGAKNDARVNLKIVEPEGSESRKTEEREEPKEEVKEEETKETVEEDENEEPMADLEL